MRIGKWVFVVLGLFAAGCETAVRYFRITSFPDGARVFVDGELRGETNFEKLGINFESEERLSTVLVKKDGYQATGTVLSLNSPKEIAFFLQEAPKNHELLAVLKNILQVLDRLSTNLSERAEEGKQ